MPLILKLKVSHYSRTAALIGTSLAELSFRLA